MPAFEKRGSFLNASSGKDHGMQVGAFQQAAGLLQAGMCVSKGAGHSGSPHAAAAAVMLS